MSSEAEVAALLTRFLSPHTSASDRSTIEASLIQVRDGPGAWRWGLELLAAPAGAADARAGATGNSNGSGSSGGGGGAALQWLAAAAVESAVLRKWSVLLPADRSAIFNTAWGALIPPAPGVEPLAGAYTRCHARST
jgi:hypothetical protein